jgi:hydrogenase maturation factor
VSGDCRIAADHGPGCITCGDVAVAVRVVRVDERHLLAECADEAGGLATVEIGLVEPVRPGDRLLVHAGTALLIEAAAP